MLSLDLNDSKLQTEPSFFIKKCSFEAEFFWLEKLPQYMEYLPLFIGKVMETFMGRKKRVFS